MESGESFWRDHNIEHYRLLSDACIVIATFLELEGSSEDAYYRCQSDILNKGALAEDLSSGLGLHIWRQ
jgi:hypothetical protein